MTRAEKIARAQALEKALGSPFDAAGSFSLSTCQADDEAEVFPATRLAELSRLRVNAYLVPEAHGGLVRHYDDSYEPVKALARRDMNSVFALGKNLLGSLPAHLFGPAEHKKAVSQLILDGKFVSLACTEKTNGSDLLATQTLARKAAEGWQLDGEKWLINNLAIADKAYVLARTNLQGGPLGFGLFLADLKQASSHVEHGAQIKLLGGRGMKLGSAKFHQLPIKHEDCLGETTGFQQALKIFQVSRGLCATMALGAVETSLRLTVEFTLKRHLYGNSLATNPVQRQRLAECYARFQLLDLCAYVASRAVSQLPQELSVISAFAKYYIPTQAELIMRELAVALGARYYLREGWYHGFFQRATRDVPLISLFDGSTQVNLYILANQLPQLLQGGETSTEVAACFDIDRDLPEFDFTKLQLTNRGDNSLLLPLRQDAWAQAQLADLQRDSAATTDEALRFQLAERYVHLMALAFLEGGLRWGQSFSPGVSVYLRSLVRNDLRAGAEPSSAYAPVFDELVARVEADRNLGVLDYPVAPFFRASKEQNFG